MSRRVIDDPGLPHGNLLSGSSSFFLPIPPKMVFNFFSSNRSRTEVSIFVLWLFQSFLFVISGARVSNLNVEDYLQNYKTFSLNPYIWWSTVGLAKGNACDPTHDTPLQREPRSGVTVFKILVSTSIEESLLFVIIKLWLNFEKLHNRQKLLVQESWSDPVASHIVFGLVENEAMNWIITRGDLGYIPVIRWGFTVFTLDVYRAPVKLLAYLIKTNAKK